MKLIAQLQKIQNNKSTTKLSNLAGNYIGNQCRMKDHAEQINSQQYKLG